jgi:hypothetical protein
MKSAGMDAASDLLVSTFKFSATRYRLLCAPLGQAIAQSNKKPLHYYKNFLAIYFKI